MSLTIPPQPRQRAAQFSRTIGLAAPCEVSIEQATTIRGKSFSVSRAKTAISNPIRLTAALGALGLLAACAGNERPTTELAAAQVNTIGVNAYLWRGALETLSFAPLASADSAGGVIVTDWFANPSNPNERVKLSVTILDQDLRADALRVSASRQVAQGSNWVDAPVQAATVQKLEDIILTKARDLRRKALSS